MEKTRQSPSQHKQTLSRLLALPLLHFNLHCKRERDMSVTSVYQFTLPPFECCIGIFFITRTTTKTPRAELPDSRRGLHPHRPRCHAAHRGQPVPLTGVPAALPSYCDGTQKYCEEPQRLGLKIFANMKGWAIYRYLKYIDTFSNELWNETLSSTSI